MKPNLDALVEHFLNGGFFLEEMVELLERRAIEVSLASHDGNQCATAKALGIHRNTLQRKMTEFQVKGRGVRRKPVTRAASPKRKQAAS